MIVLENYLLKHSVFNSLIEKSPDNSLSISIVIPCFNEPEIINSLNSLLDCTSTQSSVEVIVVFNQSENISQEINIINRNGYNNVINWALSNSTSKLTFHALFIENIKHKDATL